MGSPLPFHAAAPEYQHQAEQLLAQLHAGDNAAQWRVKWEHPRFRDKGIEDVRRASLSLDDAQEVIARAYGFEDWAALVSFANRVRTDERVARFEQAVEAVISGDVATLRDMLRAHPELVHARSSRRHHATLLHYIAANGVEGHRQTTPRNAVEVTTVLLEAGADVDALADMYDQTCTTMSMLVSSTPPHAAGLQTLLAQLLVDHGAALDGAGSKWQSTVQTALAFGFLDTARALADRGARVDDIVTAAGLGRADLVSRLLPSAGAADRHAALALSAQHGQTAVLRVLLDAGEDPSRYNPDGFHAHSTPLHQAVWSNHIDAVRMLVERGARLDVRDKLYDATPLGWAEYGERADIAEYLRNRLGA